MKKGKLMGLIVGFFVGLVIGLGSLIKAFFSLSDFKMLIVWLIIGFVSLAIACACAYFGDFKEILGYT